MTPSFRRTGAILLRQIYLVRGSIARLLPLFAWVAIDMVLWGYLAIGWLCSNRRGLLLYFSLSHRNKPQQYMKEPAVLGKQQAII